MQQYALPRNSFELDEDITFDSIISTSKNFMFGYILEMDLNDILYVQTIYHVQIMCRRTGNFFDFKSGDKNLISSINPFPYTKPS